jgi:hypothetical protein
MRTLGISIARLEAGEGRSGHGLAFAQQNGFVHAGIITAGLEYADDAGRRHPHSGVQDQSAGAREGRAFCVSCAGAQAGAAH